MGIITLIYFNYILTHIITHFMKILLHKVFFPKISKPTRSYGSFYKLIDNVFTNNLCKRLTSGILIHQISDHFITFSVVEGKIK